MGEKAFTRKADQEGASKAVEGAEAGEQRIVLAAEFAEAEAWVEDDGVQWNAGLAGAPERGAEPAANEGFDGGRVEAWKRMPLRRGSAGVHEDKAGRRASVGQSEGHGGIPGEPADVVDDLGAALDGGASGGAVIGVDGEDGLWASFADGFEDGKQARLLFSRGDRLGVGPGGFGADIKDAGAAVENSEAVLDGGVEVEELAAIGEAVGGDVEDAHDEGAFAQLERAGAKSPGVPGAGAKGHPGILEAGGLPWHGRGWRGGRRC